MSHLTTQCKKDIDKLWTEFWTSGITNPLTTIEQISFLIFSRLLDHFDRDALGTHNHFLRLFNGTDDPRRWRNFKQTDASEMFKIVRDEVFLHFRSFNQNTTFSTYMKDAQLVIQSPSLLASAVHQIDKLPILNSDIQGDLYEYLLSKLTTAGINGQFRTPRHIIEFMVKLLNPRPGEIVGDPACGTAGFLVGTMQHLLDMNPSQLDKSLSPNPDQLLNNTFYGFDLDITMLRIASMNLMLHGINNPSIFYQNTLSNNFLDNFPQHAHNSFDIIFANPPFKGNLDNIVIDQSLTKTISTKRSEILFIVLILRLLKENIGRSAAIVPDGVLFGSTKAHLNLRKLLVKHNRLDAIIKLPSGVFKPYASVSTAILVFSKGGMTQHVFFYEVTADGFSLDDRRLPTTENDLTDALIRWKSKNAAKDTDRNSKCFMVPVSEIENNDFDLSINRYQKPNHAETNYLPPSEILSKLRHIESEITKELKELDDLL